MNAINMNFTALPFNEIELLEVENSQVRIPKITADVFVTSDELRSLIVQTAADRRMLKASFQIRGGDILEASRYYATHQTSNLVIVESASDRETLFHNLELLSKECVSGTKVIVIGHANDVSIYRDLIDMGVGDYLVTPLEPIDLMRSISKLYVGVEKPKLGRISVFLGARGGVGSSTIAHNVAATLASIHEYKPLLIDMDLEFGSAALNFNVDPHIVVADVLSNGDDIDDGLLDRAAVQSHGLRILGNGTRVDREFDISVSHVEKLVEVLATNAGHSIIDLPMPRSDIERRMIQAADEVVITATPDIVSLRNVKNLIEYCKRTRPNDPMPRIVLNQVGTPRRPEISKYVIRATLQVDPIASIPFDATTFGAASNNGQLVAETCKASTLKSFQKIANVLLGGKHNFPSNTPSSFLRRFIQKVS